MDLENIAEQLDLWPNAEPVRLTLVNYSENHTFRLDGQDQSCRILRIHRPGYQGDASIISELDWIRALGEQSGVLVPQPIAGADGQWVQKLQFAEEEGGVRNAVMFAFNKGMSPDETSDQLPDLFEQLGEITAKCHLHAQKWQRPEQFTRPDWNVSSMLSEDGLWGNWRVAPNLEDNWRQTLEKAQTELSERFAEYGTHPDNHGLIHADMRLANFLVHDGVIRLLDFDDCGFGWFVYDFAASISFFENSDIVPALKQKWLSGYQKHRMLSGQDLGMFDAAILLRRMLLLAWVGSHFETELAQSLSENFAKDTFKLAKRFLKGKALS